VTTLLARYKDYRDAFVWMVRNLAGERWLQERLSVSREKLLIGMVNLLDLTFRDIANKRDGAANRRTNRQVQEYLFTEGQLLEYLMAADTDGITRLYSLLDDVKDLDPSIRINLKHKIKERFPDFRFLGEPEAEKVSLGLLVTRASFESKQRELKHLIDVEIPENSREIGEAMSKGDLRENAEYKAALEKQEMLKTVASRMQEEVQQAQIFNENEVRTDRIGFGTHARLKNLGTGKVEEYIVLGPWESDPERNVISYLSPLGAALWDHAPGEEFVFTINQNEFRYLVESIERATLPGGVT
jgi:transcription elongation factor GreA